jgi:hypothetical protein
MKSKHRVGRVQSFFSSRRNWDSPTSLPAGECAPPPPPLWFRGIAQSTLACGRGGEGVPNSDEGTYTVDCGTLYMYVLCEHKLRKKLTEKMSSYSFLL